MAAKVRVIIPDSHGNHVDKPALAAFLGDVKILQPDEIVALGDHLDCGGVFNSHQRSYSNELTESYEEDTDAANHLLDMTQKAAPKAEWHYLEGNHEGHVERWVARAFTSHKDAKGLLERYGPEHVLQLKRRGIRYYRRSEHYMGISIPGCIRLGKCFFVHGICANKHAASVHLARFGASVVFGHVHRSQSVIERTVTSSGIGAWCPGTLAKLQPLYMHTNPTSWSHGYACQFINSSGNFLHINVPILGGKSMLMDVAQRIA
jgi:UDP-2,3-diacylglucosamine pyrophosphatase LpxH